MSNQQGIWLCSLRQTLPSINHFVHCCIENGTKPDTFLLKVESSTLLQYEVRDSNYRRKARLTAHTHTQTAISDLFLFLHCTASFWEGASFTIHLPKTFWTRATLCYLKPQYYKPSPQIPPSLIQGLQHIAQRPGKSQRQQLTGDSTSPSHAAVRCFPRVLPQRSSSSDTLPLHLCWRKITAIMWFTAVRKDGNPITNCFYTDSINNVTNSALHTFAKCTRLKS